MLKYWQEAIQEENDIDVIYDEKPASPSAFEAEKAIEVLQQFTLFCDEGEDSQKVLSKVNTYSQRAIAKRKKQKTIKDYFKLWFFKIICFHVTYYA